MTVTTTKPAPTWSDRAVSVAPYALLRVSALPYPAPDPDTEPFRALMRALRRCEESLAAVAGPLAAELHDSRATLPRAFHRRVVLPLRRDVHNGRTPTPATRAALGALPDHVPLLRRWLDEVDERVRLTDLLATAVDPALAADRAALAALCGEERLQRAVALSSTALLSGLHRAAAAGGTPDARGRKAEPGIVRYALRAATKTSPWSWFTAVGWGRWDAGGSADDLDRVVAHGVARPNHVHVATFVDALLATPRLRRTVAHQLAPAVTVTADRIGFRRDEFVRARRFVATAEQHVLLARTGALQAIVAELRRAGPAGRTLEELSAWLADRLPVAAPRHAAAYVDRLADERLLVPIPPVDAQLADPLPALADWLDGRDLTDLAGMLRTISREGHGFADLDAAHRPAALRRVDAAWRAAFTAVGARSPDTAAVQEDVVLPGHVGLGKAAGRDIRTDLVRLAPLTELFDDGAAVRRLLLHTMVRRFGPGGRCTVAELVDDAPGLWADLARMGTDAATDGALPPDLRAFAAARQEVTAAAHAIGPDDAGEVVLPDRLVADAAAAVPTWMLRRPSSYAYFVQPFRAGERVRWCLNLIGDGWGRYTSRFLGSLDPELARAVAAQLRTVFGGGRVAQFRPVSGFNANLHPLLVGDDVGEDVGRSTLHVDDLEVVHDVDGDALRLRVRSTGEPVDVLYLGFLVQAALPDRSVPLHLDLAGSRATLARLAAPTATDVDGWRVWRRPRVRFGDVVLARRTWILDRSAVAGLVSTMDGGHPAEVVARWSARLGLPEALFVAGYNPEPFNDPDAMRAYLEDPKPQFVDLGSALHQRCLGRLLSRFTVPVRLEEALPVPGTAPTGRRAVELVVETYRTRG